jgi:excisionase family DNA binding protein
MSTRYHRNGLAAYECAASRADQMATPTCRSISAITVDEAVAARLLDALNPQEVALALAAADEVAERRGRRSRAAELAVERARYEAERAERAFHACEPENRLVARSLESRWEARLVAVAEAEKALAEAQAAAPPLPSRAELEALTADVAQLWQAPTTADRDRKRLLRTLIADVTLLPEPDLAKARIGIRWHTGASEEVIVARRMAVVEFRRTDHAAVELARRIGATMDNAALAAELNAAGFRTGAGRTFDCDAVSSMRHYHGIGSPELLLPGELTVRDVAQRLGVNQGTVIEWINRGRLAARRGISNRWCIPFGPEIEAAWRRHVATSAHVHRDADGTPKSPGERSVAQVAAALGVATDVVYYWTERNHVPWRRGPGGRKYIDFTTDVEARCRQRVAESVHLPAAVKTQAQSALTGGAV